MTTKAATYNYRLNQWTELIRECRSSGQTTVTGCEQIGIHPQQYYLWPNRVRQAVTAALPNVTQNPTFVPVSVNQSSAPVDPMTSHEVVAALCVGDLTIQLTNGASAELIESILQATRHDR